MALKIYNTMSGEKEAFRPIHEGKISLYVCGVTVYDYCHIGHARVLVAFDAITRYLRSQSWDVTYVRNITDIDDKILQRAAENEELYTNLTDRMIEAMHRDERAIGVLPPDREPRATEHIEDIINMVQSLVDNHYAYLADNGDVYYRIKRFPLYGRLSKKNPDELLAGARIDPGESKEDPRDFVLWKAAGGDEIGWQSPWGKGRPGWHIECSAMSTCLLGDTFDIHGGGPDLPFPHHENEIAQSEAATGKTFVNYWLHAGAVRTDNEKMSKSLDNFSTIRDVLKKYHPEVVRYFLLSSHYRSPINYSEENLIEARHGLDRFYNALRAYQDVTPIALTELKQSQYYRRYVEVMNDDFNTREAFSVMYEMVRDLNIAGQEDPQHAPHLAAELRALGGILGILQEDAQQFLQGTKTDIGTESGEIEALINERESAKENKNYRRADEIRAQLKEQGIILEDSRGGTLWRRE
jgi:cysteinyl-tRNA synthetase